MKFYQILPFGYFLAGSGYQMCNFNQNDLILNRRNCSNDLLGRIITRVTGSRCSRTSYTSNVPLCDHFFIILLISDAVSAGKHAQGCNQ